jgi:hypothetical protein
LLWKAKFEFHSSEERRRRGEAVREGESSREGQERDRSGEEPFSARSIDPLLSFFVRSPRKVFLLEERAVATTLFCSS